MVDLNPQRIDNRSVRTNCRTSCSEVSCWLVFGGCFVILLLGYAALHDRILAMNYEIERIKEDNIELGETNNALRAEHSLLANPMEIENVAKSLGLISATNQDEVTILEGEPLETAPRQVAQTRHQPEVMYE